MKRDEYKQHKYTDEQDGPSPMQILGHEKAFKDLNLKSPTYYEKERQDHLDSISSNTQMLGKVQSMLYPKRSGAGEASAKLTTPLERRNEVKQMRSMLDKF